MPYEEIKIYRYQDLLELKFRLHNLKRTLPSFVNNNIIISTNQVSRNTLTRISENEDAFIEVIFPPQDLAEESNTIPPEFMLSSNSRLVFRIPKEIRTLDYSIPSLLNWNDFKMVLDSKALPPSDPIISTLKYLINHQTFPPLSEVLNLRIANAESSFDNNLDFIQNNTTTDKLKTEIICPFGLVLSPNQKGRWIHSYSPRIHNEIVDIWHTRLEGNRSLRAIDFEEGPNFLTLNKGKRDELVNLTSDPEVDGWRDRIILAKLFILSSIGATLDVIFGPYKKLLSDFNLKLWKHRTSWGRTMYVNTEMDVFIWPFGLHGTYVEIDERKYSEYNGKIVAKLYNKKYIIIDEPERNYPGIGQKYEGRTFPFETIIVSPIYLEIDEIDINRGGWIKVDNKEFMFTILGRDFKKNWIEFECRLFCTSKDEVEALFKDSEPSPSTVLSKKSTLQEYNEDTQRVTVSLKQQKIALAKINDSEEDASFEVDRMVFNVESAASHISELLDNGQAPFYPSVASAKVDIPALRQLLGKASDNKTIEIEYSDIFKQVGLPSNWDNSDGYKNPSRIFAKLKDLTKDIPLEFPAEKFGGIVVPSIPKILALSSEYGPLGGGGLNSQNLVDSLKDLASGHFDPRDIFGQATKLLGGITLADILEKVNLINGGDRRAIPQIITREIYSQHDPSVLEGIETYVKWTTTQLKTGEFPFVKFIPDKDLGEPELDINSTSFLSVDGSEQRYEVTGKLTNFALAFFDIIKVKFSRLAFSSRQGQKMDMDPKLSGVSFNGSLRFVQALADYLENLGLGGLSIRLESQSIIAGFSLAIPNITVGVFNLNNISFLIEARISLEKDDPMSMKFCFGEKDNRFSFTIYFLGGGGFFCIALGAKGIISFETAFEVQAKAAIDVGIASASMSISLGLYYLYEIDEETGRGVNNLEAYFEFLGQLDLFGGFISVSVFLHLGLYYTSSPKDTVGGQALLEISARFWIFSINFSMTFERKFTDPEPPIRYSDLKSQLQWEEYCDAFDSLEL